MNKASQNIWCLFFFFLVLPLGCKDSESNRTTREDYELKIGKEREHIGYANLGNDIFLRHIIRNSYRKDTVLRIITTRCEGKDHAIKIPYGQEFHISLSIGETGVFNESGRILKDSFRHSFFSKKLEIDDCAIYTWSSQAIDFSGIGDTPATITIEAIEAIGADEDYQVVPIKVGLYSVTGK